MKIALFKPEPFPLSMLIYADKIVKRLERDGIEFKEFTTLSDMPRDVDLYWDPRVHGGGTSQLNRYNSDKPIVLTNHGTALFSLKIRYLKRKFGDTWRIVRDRYLMSRAWRYLADHYDQVITVSEYAKSEIQKHQFIPPSNINIVSLAADTEIFNTKETTPEEAPLDEPYFYHISVYQPKKNVKRMIKAYTSITETVPDIPNFLITAPDFKENIDHPKIKLIRDKITPEENAVYMKNGLAFIFPSLHETFGLPIVEAMACGLPVITSSETACPETAGDAALLVDPYDKGDIASAIIEVARNEDLREDLKVKGLKRAEQFSWDKCADCHQEIFENVICKGRS